MRRLTAAALALSICTFLSPGVALAAEATARQDQFGAIRAVLEQWRAAGVPESVLAQAFEAELVDASGKVVATQPATPAGTIDFPKVTPGNYTVRLFVKESVFRAEALGTGARRPAGSASVSVTAGATSNVTVSVTAAAAAAAASAATAAGGTTTAAGSPGLFGLGPAGTVLAGAAAAGLITGIALARNNDSSPSR